MMATFPQDALNFSRIKPGDKAKDLIKKDKIVSHPIKKERHISRFPLQKLIEEQREIQTELNKDMSWVQESPCGEELL